MSITKSFFYSSVERNHFVAIRVVITQVQKLHKRVCIENVFLIKNTNIVYNALVYIASTLLCSQLSLVYRAVFH